MPNRSKTPWAWRLVASLIAPLLVFALLEGGLRAFRYGYPTEFLIRSQNKGQTVWVENPKFSWPYLGPALARTPFPLSVPAAKQPGTYRIFVFGESAAYGDPQPDFGFCRILEALLSERFPGTRFEVVNAAMTAINSHVILPIARDCAEHDGDLWVIYMGNNEVVGPFGRGTVFGSQSPMLPVIRSSVALKSTRTGELIGNLLKPRGKGQGDETEWQGMSMFLKQQVRSNDPGMQGVYAHFERNLEDILRVGKNHGVKMVVSTVGSNLRDCAPFASLHRAGLSPGQISDWDRLFQAGIAAQNSGNMADAEVAFAKAAEIDPEYAELQFRWARCCLALNRVSDASAHFIQARDYDTLRFRCDTRLNEIIRETASNRENEGVYFADAQTRLAQASTNGLPGHELFYEHVHFTFDGNYLLARTIADQALRILPANISAQAKPNWISISDCAERLAWTDWNRCDTARSVLLRINDPPFATQIDHAEQNGRLQEQVERLAQPAMLTDSLEIYRKAVVRDPNDWILQNEFAGLQRKLGNTKGAIEAWRRAADLMPHETSIHVQLGLLLTQEQQCEQAIEEFESALRLNPGLADAMTGIGAALTLEKKYPEALQQFQNALQRNPHSMETHLKMGAALESMGRQDEARHEYRLAMERKPLNAEALIMMGRVCMNQGWAGDALTNFAGAVQLDPTDANARLLLGGVLSRLGQRAAAQQNFNAAVRLNPNVPEAHLGLGIEYGMQGKHAEAAEQFAEAARLNPKMLDARMNLAMALLNLHKNEEATSEFREVLKLDPNNLAARKYLEKLGAN